MTKVVTSNQSRANIYKLLSLCYQPPYEDLDNIVSSLREEIDKLPAIKYKIGTLAEELASCISDLEHTKVDHAKLFIGPFDLLAPPYGSIYLEGKRKVMGDTTMEVMIKYQEAGLKLDDEFKEPPDHITIELEFMYYLIFKELQGQETNEYQTEFLINYLEPWVGEFCHRIIQNAGNDFYKLLAKITASFIKADMKVNSLVC